MACPIYFAPNHSSSGFYGFCFSFWLLVCAQFSLEKTYSSKLFDTKCLKKFETYKIVFSVLIRVKSCPRFCSTTRRSLTFQPCPYAVWVRLRTTPRTWPAAFWTISVTGIRADRRPSPTWVRTSTPVSTRWTTFMWCNRICRLDRTALKNSSRSHWRMLWSRVDSIKKNATSQSLCGIMIDFLATAIDSTRIWAPSNSWKKSTNLANETAFKWKCSSACRSRSHHGSTRLACAFSSTTTLSYLRLMKALTSAPAMKRTLK